MKTKFLNTVSAYNMFSPGQKILVGVSGGADSMCLLHLLWECAEDLQITLEVAHLNHCIRGVEADRDEKFVETFCNKIGVVFHSKRVDIPKIAEDTGESIELCARRIRYEFFNSLNADIVATAHTGSDRIETMLMNLSRGAALNGLCSIPAVRGNIVRPLIDFTRNEIERYCSLNSVDFITDSTNLTDDYTRNKFRHNVITELIKINPAFETNALRCIRSLNVDCDYLDSLSLEYYNRCITENNVLDVTFLLELHNSVKKRVLINFIAQNSNSEYEMRHIDFILQHLGEKFSLSLPGNDIIISDAKYVRFKKESVKSIDTVSITCKENRIIDFQTKRLILKFDRSIPENTDNVFVVDADKLGSEMVIRSRQSGDYFHLFKRRCSKSLNKLFNEMKIPAEERDSIVVISDEKGLIYVEKIGIDSFRCIDRNTKKYLLISMEDKV